MVTVMRMGMGTDEEVVQTARVTATAMAELVMRARSMVLLSVCVPRGCRRRAVERSGWRGEREAETQRRRHGVRERRRERRREYRQRLGRPQCGRCGGEGRIDNEGRREGKRVDGDENSDETKRQSEEDKKRPQISSRVDSSSSMSREYE